jgi:arsenate reductase (glutaredoxin)
MINSKAEVVLDILPLPQLNAFTKDDGERVINAEGNRVN